MEAILVRYRSVLALLIEGRIVNVDVVAGDHVKRGVSSRVLRVDVGSVCHEHLAHVEVAVLRGDVQRGVAVLWVLLVRGGLGELVLRLIRVDGRSDVRDVWSAMRWLGAVFRRYESYREIVVWGGARRTSLSLVSMADTSSTLFHRTAECSC